MVSFWQAVEADLDVNKMVIDHINTCHVKSGGTNTACAGAGSDATACSDATISGGGDDAANACLIYTGTRFPNAKLGVRRFSNPSNALSESTNQPNYDEFKCECKESIPYVKHYGFQDIFTHTFTVTSQTINQHENVKVTQAAINTCTVIDGGTNGGCTAANANAATCAAADISTCTVRFFFFFSNW